MGCIRQDSLREILQIPTLVAAEVTKQLLDQEKAKDTLIVSHDQHKAMELKKQLYQVG